MSSDASPPSRQPRRKPVLFWSALLRGSRTPFAPRYRIIWWIGALLPSITIALEFAGLLDVGNHPYLTPLNTLFASVVVCTAASYSQRRDIQAILMDLLVVMLLVLIQVTVIAKLAELVGWSAGLPVTSG